MPETIPHLGIDFFKSDLSYPELAVGMIHPFTKDDLTHAQLTDICDLAFDFPLRIKELNKTDSVLELFHGPTFAFKDFAARFMARTMSYFLKNNDNELTILVATSGDTGSAVANGFFNVDGINVIILYPSNRVSAIQEKQLTTLGGNITALEIDGSFDDCQRMVKAAFQDIDLQNRLSLSSANSINMARLLPQSVYYSWAWKLCAENKPIIDFIKKYSIPTADVNKSLAFYMDESDGDMVETAKNFLSSNNMWESWVPSDVASKVKASL